MLTLSPPMLRRIVLTVLGLALLPGPTVWAGDGAQIYQQQCARCHGPQGEGTEEYPRALAGQRSVNQLAKLIAKTMPEDDPGTCVGEDAEKVAAYIHNTFYSPVARARNQPARVELSRLTVRQYRNAVADLVGSFRQPGKWDEARGLKAEYYKSRRFRNNERVIERIDPTVSFDWGEEAPDPEKFDAQEFSIRWEGSVLAPETGEYEFVVRTDHAARLWVNDVNRPLIDAWVKSGDDTEYRESLFLVGGRVYPLKLEFSKAKQGVDDSKKGGQKPAKKAMMALAWRRPHQAVEVIAERYLTPNRFPETFVVTTPFPPDDRSIGYERGTSVSKEWDEATTNAAIETAGYVSTRVRDLYGIKDDASDRAEKYRDFARQFVKRAFRRPPTDEQFQIYVNDQFEEAKDPAVALRRVILLTLKSPRFLYRELGANAGPYDVASRLSFGLWDSLPDAALLEAASKGELATREQVTRQAERMLADSRTRSKLRDFLMQWLKADQVTDIGKDPGLYPDFNAEVATDLRTSLELFLDEVVWSDTADFRQFLLEDSLYINGRLARFYGADLSADAPFQKQKLNPDERAGVISHPYLMSTFAYTSSTSPIHRGVFLARGVLGQMLRQPPEAVAPLAPDLHPNLTTRERVTVQTSPQACLSCHSLINPLGFPLERFDAVGRFRDEERGKPIDASGTYLPRSGETATFQGARDLGRFLAGSEEVHDAFVEQLFHALVQQPVRAYGPDTQARLRQFFVTHDFHIRKLMVEILAITAQGPHADQP